MISMSNNNIGISFSSNYLKQGSDLEKIKIANKNNISNILLSVRDDKESVNFDENKKKFDGNIIYNIPTVSYNNNNLKDIESLVKKIQSKKSKMDIINPTNIIESDFEWSTKTEQNQIFKNITKSIASLASSKMLVLLENPVDVKDKIYYGHTIEQFSDILVHSRELLVKDYGFTESDANKYIKVSINTKKLNNSELEKWFSSFNDSIKVIKLKYNPTSYAVDYIKNNLMDRDVLLFLITNSDLDDVINEYNLLYSNFYNNKVVKSSSKKLKPSDIVQICIIIITILIALLMIYVKFHS